MEMGSEHHGLRVALYSPGMVGLGHMRRSLLLAQTIVGANAHAAVLFIGEARQAGNLAIPAGVDCLTLPALQKGTNGHIEPRYLDISLQQLVALRANTIATSLKAFAPDVLIVDHLPRGACAELDIALPQLKRRGTRLVLGLRDIIEARETVEREWKAAKSEKAIAAFYDAVWVYGDRRVCDQAQEYGYAREVAEKVHYVGYLDQRARLADLSGLHREQFDALDLPAGKLILCTVGGGGDGVRLAETFAAATLPDGAHGVILTGPFMPAASQQRVRAAAAAHPRMRVIEFLSEPTLLMDRADAVISMGGYNSAAEAVSFGKPVLLVPRSQPRQEQSIRAERFEKLGLVETLSVEALTVEALSAWLRQHRVPTAAARRSIDMGGTKRLPRLLRELLQQRNTNAPISQALLGSAPSAHLRAQVQRK
jgi:predicted glycosyltransferase